MCPLYKLIISNYTISLGLISGFFYLLVKYVKTTQTAHLSNIKEHKALLNLEPDLDCTEVGNIWCLTPTATSLLLKYGFKLSL